VWVDEKGFCVAFGGVDGDDRFRSGHVLIVAFLFGKYANCTGLARFLFFEGDVDEMVSA
jgi:hypothetical protein